LVDGTCEQIVGKRIIQRVKQYGEPFKFGIKEGMLKKFLSKRGFSQIQDLTSEEYKKLYFHGKNEDREVCSIYSFAYAVMNKR
jgi:O-methyltransferase involved in polyketide biosynthesis